MAEYNLPLDLALEDQSIHQKGMHLKHDFYVVGKQCRTENAYTGHQYNVFI